MSDVRPGDTIAGKFRVERILGEGGMGFVVAARHLQLGQTVAIKFMREEVLTPEYRSRFLREARNTARLKSKHVSRVLDIGSATGGVPYMVLEYLEGIDLSALLHQHGPMPLPHVSEYIIQACEAIAEAHSLGIVHRDLKPANLFLTTGPGGEPVVKVLDFGVSKVLGLVGQDDDIPLLGAPMTDDFSVVTKASELLGSPSYMSPEQMLSSRDAGAKSDVWSLGVILFRLVTGSAPFAARSLAELIQSVVHDEPPDVRTIRPELPAEFARVIVLCMQKDPTHRPSVVQLARMLAPFAGPNAAPSLERIAILGPALVTVPGPSAPAFSAAPSSAAQVSARPLPAARRPHPVWHRLKWATFGGLVGGATIVLATFIKASLGLGQSRGVSVMSADASSTHPTAPVMARAQDAGLSSAPRPR